MSTVDSPPFVGLTAPNTPRLAGVEPRERLSDAELRSVDVDWRAANYLTIGQIYLRDQHAFTALASSSTWPLHHGVPVFAERC